MTLAMEATSSKLNLFFSSEIEVFSEGATSFLYDNNRFWRVLIYDIRITTPVQYNASFHGARKEISQLIIRDSFLIFAPDIDCWCSLEPPQRKRDIRNFNYKVNGSPRFLHYIYCAGSEKPDNAWWYTAYLTSLKSVPVFEHTYAI